VVVAVVSWNTRDLLAGCLRSLQPDGVAGRCAVWVVDNGSTDGSPDLVRSEFGWVHLVEPGENLGFGPAVNLVAEQSSSEWIAPANADLELAPGALEVLLDAGRAEPRIGCVAPRLMLPDGSTQHSVYAFPGPGLTLVTHFGLHRLSRRLGDKLCVPGSWNPNRARPVDWAVGAFLLVRREAWQEAGGFDPAQWMFAEDVDLGWRLARAGWIRRYEPRAVVLHHESAATGAAFGSERTMRTMDATYEWIGRRRGRAAARLTAGSAWAAMRARQAMLTPLARAWPDRFAAGRERAAFWASVHRRAGCNSAAARTGRPGS
jgi:N-acetylglucosaminyl-diphospho-decaprenol L-rhamnosyltransferase